jgi:hypothetical protein
MKTKKSPFGENSLPKKERKKERKKKPTGYHWYKGFLKENSPKSRHILRGKKKVEIWPNVFSKFYFSR